MNIDYSKFTKHELLEINSKLNRWEWDDRLGIKPDNFDNMPDFLLTKHDSIISKRDILEPIRMEIKKHVTEKETMHYHNVEDTQNPFRMTQKQFKKYWRNQTLEKIFHIGFYSNNNKKIICEILQGIAQNQQDKWNEENYS